MPGKSSIAAEADCFQGRIEILYEGDASCLVGIMSRVFRLESCPNEGPFFLEASAGTGKTHTLERIVAHLVGRNENPLQIENILVVTFTNRAAREMKERIRNYLLRLSSEGKEEERSRYLRAISSFDRAAIYTIHGFCRMVLSSWPFESASPFNQELSLSREPERQAIRAWISGLHEENSNWKLIRPAYRSSRGVEELIQDLVRRITSDNIPARARVEPGEKDLDKFVNFFETSGAEGSGLERASNKLFKPDWDAAVISAVFSEGVGKRKRAVSVESIKEYMKACRGIRDLDKLSEVAFDKDSGKHFLELLGAALASESANFKLGKPLADALVKFFAQIEPYAERPIGKDDSLISLIDRYMYFALTDPAMCEIRKRIERAKLSTGQLNYADLIRRVTENVQAPDSPLLPILRNRFSAALIDEFQDTDPKQWMLFKRVFGESDTGHVLGLIGDPKQSIYGFRGTGLQTYLEARNLVPRERVFRLGTNYRSKENLVRAANRFFAPLFESAEFSFEPAESGYKGERVLEWPDAKAAINMLGVESRRDSAELIAGYIRRLLDSEEGGIWRMADGSRERVLASDIAVLVRRGVEEEEISRLLRGLGIRAQRLRSQSIFDQEIVSLLDGLLSAFDNPRDASRWRSLLLGNFFSLPPEYLDCFEREGRLDEFIEKGDECRIRFNSGHATKAIEDFFRFSTVLGTWISAAGNRELGTYLESSWPERILAESEGERIWQDWRHICELIQSKQSDGMRDISLIREWMQEGSTLPDDDEDAIRLESEEPAVRVLTMHKAKGLEFPLVFIHGGYGHRDKKSRKWPWREYRFVKGGELVIDRLQLNSNRERHLLFEWEEAKRLWYVAFTRAVERLWIPIVSGKLLTEGESLLAQSLELEGVGSKEFGKIPPHQIIGNGKAFREKLHKSLNRLCRSEPELFSFSKGKHLELPPLESPVIPEPTAASLPTVSFGDRDLARSSFTSLTSEKRSASGVLWDADKVPLSSDGGTNFGDLIHKLFEHCNFERARELGEKQWCEDEEIDNFFQDNTLNFYNLEWYTERASDLKKIVWRCLHAKIPNLGCLCDVRARARKTEVEFVMAVRKDCRLNLKDIDKQVFNGFLSGFIDLLICTGSSWWVVDWKTNLPPEKHWEGAYDDKILRLIMNERNHHFQYELYLLALCVSLSAEWGRAVNWKEEIGGAAYLFVRGIKEGRPEGIYSGKPSLDRMLELTSALGVGDVLI